MKLETPTAVIVALLAFLAWCGALSYLFAWAWARQIGHQDLPARRWQLYRSSRLRLLLFVFGIVLLSLTTETPLLSLTAFALLGSCILLASYGGHRAYFHFRKRRDARSNRI